MAGKSIIHTTSCRASQISARQADCAPGSRTQSHIYYTNAAALLQTFFKPHSCISNTGLHTGLKQQERIRVGKCSIVDIDSSLPACRAQKPLQFGNIGWYNTNYFATTEIKSYPQTAASLLYYFLNSLTHLKQEMDI